VPWKDWLQHNTDKFLLVFLWVVSLYFVRKLIFTAGVAPENIAWAREASGTILGSILGLITGVAIGMKIAGVPSKSTGKENDNGKNE
jgi:hypothetical protein